MPADGTRWRAVAIPLALVLALTGAEDSALAQSVYWEAYGEVELEGTFFPREPRFRDQRDHGLSAAGELTILADLPEQGGSIVLTPFFRVDSADSRRTDWDLREAKLEVFSGDWSFTLGSDVVFWGKTESVHLVDIVNQVDPVEDYGNEVRLGQPMLKASYLAELGEFSVYYLPYFRERPFPGRTGRLRFAPPVDTRRPVYDTSRKEWTPSFAARYEGIFGDTDLGLSVFRGLGRDPAFQPACLAPVPRCFASVRPVYERVFQVGIDVQHTVGPTLLKAEAIRRNGQKNGHLQEDGQLQEENYVALAGGLEHTLYGIASSNADLGLIAEYAWDSRGDATLTGFQDDLFFGARITLNDARDSSLLIAVLTDMENDASSLRLEGETRVADDMTLSVVGQTFWQFDSFEPGGGRTDDDLIRVKLKVYF